MGNSILFYLSFDINALFLEQFPLRGCLNPDPNSYYVTYVSQEGSNEEVIAESKFYLSIFLYVYSLNQFVFYLFWAKLHHWGYLPYRLCFWQYNVFVNNTLSPWLLGRTFRQLNPFLNLLKLNLRKGDRDQYMIKKQVGQLIGKFKLLKVSKFQNLKFTDL